MLYKAEPNGSQKNCAFETRHAIRFWVTVGTSSKCHRKHTAVRTNSHNPIFIVTLLPRSECRLRPRDGEVLLKHSPRLWSQDTSTVEHLWIMKVDHCPNLQNVLVTESRLRWVAPPCLRSRDLGLTGLTPQVHDVPNVKFQMAKAWNCPSNSDQNVGKPECRLMLPARAML